MLCSDGVTDTVSPGELQRLFGRDAAIDGVAERLETQLGGETRPGQDNFTAILIDLSHLAGSPTR